MLFEHADDGLKVFDTTEGSGTEVMKGTKVKACPPLALCCQALSHNQRLSTSLALDTKQEHRAAVPVWRTKVMAARLLDWGALVLSDVDCLCLAGQVLFLVRVALLQH